MMELVPKDDDDEDAALDYLPKKLRSALLPFQKEGVKYGLEKQGRLLIADEMGLGKTVQALCVAYKFKENWPLLIVAPSSMRYPWIEEIEKWLPEIDPRRIRLVISQGDINEISTDRVDVVVVSYGLLSAARGSKDYDSFYRPPLVEAMFRAHFRVVILDESHYIKNPKARRTENLVDIVKKAERRILLTGTPALAKPAELFSQVDAILPGAFGTWQWYAKRYCNARYITYGKRRQWDTNGATNLEELQNKLTTSVMIRRLKAEVLTQLPPKTRQRIPFEVTRSNYKKTIDGLWKEMGSFLNDKNYSVANVINMVRNNTFSDEPEPDQNANGEGKSKIKYYSERNFLRLSIMELSMATGMAKVGGVIEYLRLLLQNSGEKFLVFAHHKSVMDGLGEELGRLSDNENGAGVGQFRYIRIDGAVPGELRMQFVRQFQTDPVTRVALLSIMAAGTGLTFTAGSHVVFAELHWTPGVLQQCEDRVHRIGQKRSVHIHYLVARDTIDEWLWAALSRKMQVVSLALNGVTQTLNPDVESDEDKLKLLTKASTWLPKEEPQIDENEEFFEQTCVAADQSFITDFFRTAPNKGRRRVPNKDKFWKKSGEAVGRAETRQVSDGSKGGESRHSSKGGTRRKRRRVEFLPTQTHEYEEEEEEEDEKEEEDFLSKSREERRKRRLRKTNGSKTTPTLVGVKRRRRIEVLDDPFEMAEEGEEEEEEEESSLLDDEEVHVDDGDDDGDFDASEIKDGDEGADPTAIQPEKEATTAGDALQWSCKSCTFLNYSQLKSCEICESPRVKKYKKAVDDAEKPTIFRVADSTNEEPRDGTDHGPPNEEPRDGTDRGSSNEEPRDGTDHVQSTHVFDDSSFGASHSRAVASTPTKQLPSDESSQELEPIIGDHADVEKSSPVSLERGRRDEGMERDSGAAVTTDEDAIPDDMLDSWDEEEDFESIEPEKPPRPASQREEEPSSSKPSRIVDVAKIPLQTSLFFFASRNTDRIYVYDSRRRPLDVNFLPLDVETDNFAALPDVLLHPTHARLVRVFLREWNALTETKKRVIKKTGEIFASPKSLYEELTRDRKHCVERRMDLRELKEAAERKAVDVGGSTRTLTIPGGNWGGAGEKGKTSRGETTTTTTTTRSADGASHSSAPSASAPDWNVVQALDSEDNPLCLFCQGSITNALSKTTSSRDDVAWHTRFCRRECREEYLVKRAQTTYIRQELLLAEKGVCQICGVAAHEFYVKINEEKNLEKRKEMIEGSIFDKLRSFSKNRMVTKPSAGDFWQADHRIAVVEGGGQCDLGNFRTLCTVCHAQESKALMERVRKKKKIEKAVSDANGCADLRKFYKPI